MRVEFRAATPADARAIAELIDMSSEGVALIEWAEEAAQLPDVTPLDVGTRIYAGETGNYSYRNCVIAEVDGTVAGMLLSFALPPADPQHSPALPC